jgi:hypothetical protein
MKKYPPEAYEYLESEHIRLLMEGNRIPSVEDRVMEAFLAGVKSVKYTYSNLDVVSKKSHNINETGTINFPKWNE